MSKKGPTISAAVRRLLDDYYARRAAGERITLKELARAGHYSVNHVCWAKGIYDRARAS